jgi:hypothetical protein
MARIVKLGELLPEDIAFEMPDGSQILAPGDPPLQLLLKVAALFERSENSDDANGNLGVEVLQELDAEILALLQMRNPDMVESPFGIIGVQHVVATLLEAYGFGVEGKADPTPPARSRKPKSPRSSGSPRSSTSSTSRPTTGGR